MKHSRKSISVVAVACLALTACSPGDSVSEPPLSVSPSEEPDSAPSVGSGANALADAGDTCGSLEGEVLVALEDGTSCDIAHDVMAMYKDNLDQAEGQALFWTSPNGWGCTGRYIFPGESDTPSARKMSCSAEDRSGRPAEEGSGSVALAEPGEDYKALLDLD